MADLIIKIGATAKEFKAALDQIEGDTESFGEKVASAGKLAAVGLATLTAAITYCVKEYAEAEKVANRTNSIIKATGGVAGVSADQVSKLSASLQEQTTFSDEAIQSAQNILLTFTRIGSVVFPRATEATLDLATRMGVDASTAAQTLGKALERPMEGLSQLQRQGIFFTETQKAQIEYFEKTNQVAKAQKLILDNLATSVGGLARGEVDTLSGSFKKLANSFSDTAESIGKIFAPSVKEGTSILSAMLQTITNTINAVTKPKETKSEDNEVNDFESQEEYEASLTNVTAKAIAERDRLDREAKFRVAQAAAQDYQYKILLLEGFSSDYIGKIKEMHDLERQLQTEFDESKRANIKEVYARLKEQIAEQEAEQAAEEQAVNEAIAQANDQRDQEYITKNQQLHQKLLADNRKNALDEKTARDQAIVDRTKTQTIANNNFLLDQQKFGTAYATINKIMHSEIYQGTQSAFGDLTRLTQSNNQTLKTIGKVSAAASVTMSTAESAMNVYKGFSTIPIVGQALGVAAAAAAVAFGGEQLARVLAANEGGLVTGGIAGMDSVPAMLTPGELVVPQQNFDEVINSVIAARTGSAPSGGSGSFGGSDVRVLIDLTQDASQLITAKQIEDSRLGLSRA